MSPLHQAGVLHVLLIKNSGVLPTDVMMRLHLVFGDSRGFATDKIYDKIILHVDVWDACMCALKLSQDYIHNTGK